MKDKCVFFINLNNLVHVLISFCCSFQGPTDLVAWEDS